VIRRILMVAALVAAVLGVAAPAADAGGYATSCGFVLDPPVISSDGDVHILGAQFDPGSQVTFYIEGPGKPRTVLGTATVSDDVDGTVEATFALPEAFRTDGEYLITVECPNGDIASNTLIVGQGATTTVATAVPTAAGPLPVTGSSNTMGFVQVAAVLIAVGTLVLLAGRRRATSHRAT
jgi:LPXTG-motif cell wall-anchored protein